MTDPQTHNTLILIGIGALGLLGYLARHREPFCPDCSHCAHAQRQRAADLEKRRHDEMHDMPLGRSKCPQCDPPEDK